MSVWIQLLTAFTGSLGFALIFNIKRNRMFLAALGGFIAWGTVLLFGLLHIRLWNGWDDILCYFVAAIVLTLYSEIMARTCKTPTTVFILSATIPLIPGGALYRTMRYAVQGDRQSFANEGIHTLLLAAAISIGILVAMTLWSLVKQTFRHSQKMQMK